MHEEKVQVVAYSGHKASERPTAFVLNSRQIIVVEILDMWLEENFTYRKRKRFFIVQGSDGCTYTLSMDEETGEWFLRSKA